MIKMRMKLLSQAAILRGSLKSGSGNKKGSAWNVQDYEITKKEMFCEIQRHSRALLGGWGGGGSGGIFLGQWKLHTPACAFWDSLAHGKCCQNLNSNTELTKCFSWSYSRLSITLGHVLSLIEFKALVVLIWWKYYLHVWSGEEESCSKLKN